MITFMEKKYLYIFSQKTAINKIPKNTVNPVIPVPDCVIKVEATAKAIQSQERTESLFLFKKSCKTKGKNSIKKTP